MTDIYEQILKRQRHRLAIPNGICQIMQENTTIHPSQQNFSSRMEHTLLNKGNFS